MDAYSEIPAFAGMTNKGFAGMTNKGFYEL
jgi:hypothetical protein